MKHQGREVRWAEVDRGWWRLMDAAGAAYATVWCSVVGAWVWDSPTLLGAREAKDRDAAKAAAEQALGVER